MKMNIKKITKKFLLLILFYLEEKEALAWLKYFFIFPAFLRE